MPVHRDLPEPPDRPVSFSVSHLDAYILLAVLLIWTVVALVLFAPR
jgi:hypothetical protein